MISGLHFGTSEVKWDSINTFISETEQQRNTIQFLTAWESGTRSFNLNTSGSTGASKTIRIPRERMILSAQKTISYFGLNDQDRVLTAMNTKYIAGRMMLVRASIAGMDLTVVEPSRIPELIGEPFTFTALSPLQLEAILSEGIRLEHYKCILIGGAPLSNELRRHLASRQVPNIFETYGMTETVSHIAVRRISGKNPELSFTCIHDLQLEVDSRECLRFKGAITGNRWLQTNDRVYIHDQTRFDWLGRADWIINSGGIKIQPETLEKKIGEIASDSKWKNEFFVFGFPHPEFGEGVTLIFEGKIPESMEKVYGKLETVLDRYELPKRILSTPSFKRTETGKLLRKETADLVVPFTF